MKFKVGDIITEYKDERLLYEVVSIGSTGFMYPFYMLKPVVLFGTDVDKWDTEYVDTKFNISKSVERNIKLESIGI